MSAAPMKHVLPDEVLRGPAIKSDFATATLADFEKKRVEDLQRNEFLLKMYQTICQEVTMTISKLPPWELDNSDRKYLPPPPPPPPPAPMLPPPPPPHVAFGRGWQLEKQVKTLEAESHRLRIIEQNAIGLRDNLDRAVRFLAGLNLQDHPVKDQRAQREVVEHLKLAISMLGSTNQALFK